MSAAHLVSALATRAVPICLVMLLSGGEISAQAQPMDRGVVVIHPGFFTGNAYRPLNASSKQMYLAGQVDGLLLAPLVGGHKDELVWLERCLRGFVPTQLVAVVDKWLAENPERWNEQMNALTFSALLSTCDKK